MDQKRRNGNPFAQGVNKIRGIGDALGWIVADLEGLSSNAFFEVLEEWSTVLLAERYLLEQVLAVPDDPPIGEDQPPCDRCCDSASIASPAGECSADLPTDPPVAPQGSNGRATKARGIKR